MSVAPCKNTVTGRVHAAVGPAARNMKVNKSRRRTRPKRYSARARKSRAACCRWAVRGRSLIIGCRIHPNRAMRFPPRSATLVRGEESRWQIGPPSSSRSSTQRSHEPRLAGFTGTVRFDLAHDGEVDHWFLDIAKGDLTVSNHDGPADAVISGDRTVIDGVLAGDVNPVAATLRGVMTIAGDWDLLFLCQRLFGQGAGDDGRIEAMSDGLVRILDGNTFVVSDARGDIVASLDRPDRSVLVRHALLVEVGPDHRRRAAQRALDRRPSVLRDAVLPRAGHGDRLRRRQAVGDPPARRRRRLPRGADDPEPRRRAGRPRGPARRRLRLRRSVRGQGRARQAGEVLDACRGRTPRPRRTNARRSTARR